jgi:hypothetical protein
MYDMHSVPRTREYIGSQETRPTVKPRVYSLYSHKAAFNLQTRALHQKYQLQWPPADYRFLSVSDSLSYHEVCPIGRELFNGSSFRLS